MYYVKLHAVIVTSYFIAYILSWQKRNLHTSLKWLMLPHILQYIYRIFFLIAFNCCLCSLLHVDNYILLQYLRFALFC